MPIYILFLSYDLHPLPSDDRMKASLLPPQDILRSGTDECYYFPQQKKPIRANITTFLNAYLFLENTIVKRIFKVLSIPNFFLNVSLSCSFILFSIITLSITHSTVCKKKWPRNATSFCFVLVRNYLNNPLDDPPNNWSRTNKSPKSLLPPSKTLSPPNNSCKRNKLPRLFVPLTIPFPNILVPPPNNWFNINKLPRSLSLPPMPPPPKIPEL